MSRECEDWSRLGVPKTEGYARSTQISGVNWFLSAFCGELCYSGVAIDELN